MSERAHTCTTPRVLEYAREAFRRDIADLLDDPTDLLHPWRDREPPEALTGLRGLAQDLGLDFDALIAGGTPFERERLASIEQSLTQTCAERGDAADNRSVREKTYRAVGSVSV